MANEFKTARVAKATYDFATHGGATGNALGLGVSIPSGAIVTRVIGSANTVHYSTPVALAADSEINLDIATAALTAGNYDIFVEYLY
jgi:hypothetical protein